MPMVDAIKACFAKYADFNGRATRSEYWWFFLAVLLGSAVAWTLAYGLYVLFSLVTLLPLIAAGARRLHETNRSGWWQLLALVPFGIILVVMFLIQRGMPEEIPQNRLQRRKPEEDPFIPAEGSNARRRELKAINFLFRMSSGVSRSRPGWPRPFSLDP